MSGPLNREILLYVYFSWYKETEKARKKCCAYTKRQKKKKKKGKSTRLEQVLTEAVSRDKFPTRATEERLTYKERFKESDLFIVEIRSSWKI